MIGSEMNPDSGGMTEDRGRHRVIAIWLLVVCALIFCMVVLGGVTRLTGSGLSMVRWHPISGVVPPLTRAEWMAEFTHYQDSPEFKKVNAQMSVDEFKSIFWFEWAHRVLGRAIGFAFLLPFLFFLWRRRIPPGFKWQFFVMFLLGGLQGLLGWYMVKSGLVDDPHVSQYRLTAHLGAAILIYVYMFWVALELWRPRVRSVGAKGLLFPSLVGIVTVATILSGGFVAGLKAGYAYNTFPKMGDEWVPSGIWLPELGLSNLFENIATVQFDHRVLAITTLVLVLALVVGALGSARSEVRSAAVALGVVVIIQVALGIATLLLRVPVTIAAIHQGGALVLLTLVIYFNHAARQVSSFDSVVR